MFRKYIFGAAMFISVSAGCAAWTTFDRNNDGIPGFYVWKSFSSRAHGGQHAAVNGVNIYFETFGEGPPVVLLHGGTAFLETMHNQITDLASDHFVVAPDTRGHGRSTGGTGPLHYADMAQDVIQLMDKLHIARADVVGWSDGGIVGLDLAMHYLNRIRRLVAISANYDVAGLIDPVTPISSDSASLAAVRNFYRSVSSTPQNWSTFYAKMQFLWATEPHFSVDDLKRIRIPVLVIAGEHDVIRRDHTDELARAIPGSREIIVPSASHLAPLENPELIDPAIRAFLMLPASDLLTAH